MNVLTFKVEVKGLENKIWRIIETDDEKTLADLAYITLATFETLFDKFYTIKHGKDLYDSANKIYDNKNCKSAMTVQLKELDYGNDNKIIMEYNPRNKVTIIITYMNKKDIELPNNKHIKVIDGAGNGIIDYINELELKQIVKETDKLGYSNYKITVIENDVEKEKTIDYRDFSLEENNIVTKCNFNLIKDDYEQTKLIDLFRVINDTRVRFFKTDTQEIVEPFRYTNEWLPDNYINLPDEEREKVPVPDYEKLKIHVLPIGQQLHHQEIVKSYIEEQVVDKEEKEALLNILDSDSYLEDFYDALRKYGLFKEYLDFSYSYY